MTSMSWLQTSNHPGTAFVNQFVEVSTTLDVTAEEISLRENSSLPEQKYLN